MDYPLTVDKIKMDGGTIIFFLLIFSISQLYTNKAFKIYHKLTDKITVGVLSNIFGILSIYGLIGIYYFAMRHIIHLPH